MSSKREKSRKSQTLSDDIISSCGMSRVFKYPSGLTNGMSIDNTGKHLVTSNTEGTIRSYDLMDAKPRKLIECKKYGASCVQFTHHSKAVLLASRASKHDGTSTHCTVRYLSLHDNAYIRTFEGHTDRITAISMSHLDDSFMTSSIDKHVRIWDLRQSGCIGVCKVNGRPTMAQDPEGMVFGIGTGRNQLKLYDRRKYQHGPFETIESLPPCNYEWCDLKFSPDGKYLLISTRTNLLMLVDSFKGTLLAQLCSYHNTNNEDIVGSFTPNGRYIACGSSNGDLHFWNKDKLVRGAEERKEMIDGTIQVIENKAKVTLWKGHPRTVGHFMWNPKYMMAVSAAQNVCLWLPSEDVEGQKRTKPLLRKKNYNANDTNHDTSNSNGNSSNTHNK